MNLGWRVYTFFLSVSGGIIAGWAFGLDGQQPELAIPGGALIGMGIVSLWWRS